MWFDRKSGDGPTPTHMIEEVLVKTSSIWAKSSEGCLTVNMLGWSLNFKVGDHHAMIRMQGLANEGLGEVD